MRKKKRNEDSVAHSGGARRITPVDIQEKEFRVAFRGYNMRDVDEFLDELTEEVARLHADNRRLREEGELRGAARSGAGGHLGGDEIVRRAREEAARVVSDAEATARNILEAAAAEAGGRGGTPRGAQLSVFLVKEKDFLQRLAGLIQEHAHDLKETAARARTRSTSAVARAPEEAGRIEDEQGGSVEGDEAAAEPPGREPRESSPEEERAEPAPSAGPLDRPGTPDHPEGEAGAEPETERQTLSWQAPGEETGGEPDAGQPGGGEEMVDLTEHEAGSEEVPGGTTAGARRGRAQPEPHTDREEAHTLRELFWGED